ncbi:MAG: hypothetical protein ABR559_03190 [Gemmatimonadota bacterium]
MKSRLTLPRALAVAIAVHAIVLLIVRIPADSERGGGGTLIVVPQPVALERPTRERSLPVPATTRAPESEPQTAAQPAFRPSPAAAEEATIPSTALTELQAATLPLVATGGGVGRRRLERTAEQMATARAESLLVARMAGIGVAKARDIGAVGLANGGITLAIPWAGFLPSNRSDAGWREERCSGDGEGASDKAGEAEARRAQCG